MRHVDYASKPAGEENKNHNIPAGVKGTDPSVKVRDPRVRVNYRHVDEDNWPAGKDNGRGIATK